MLPVEHKNQRTARASGLASWLRRKSVRRAAGNALSYVLLTAGAIAILIPLAWMLSTSLKRQIDVFIFPPEWIPPHPQWSNYLTALTYMPFPRYFANTAFIAGVCIVGELISCSLVAYGFARRRAPLRDALFVLVLSTMMLPGQVTLIPLFILFRRLGWTDTFLPLTVPALFGSPFFIFLIRQFFLTISRDLEDAARIDGAGSLQILVRIIMPMATPALATVAIFSFLFHWNDLMGPLVYLSGSPEKRTVALALAFFIGLSTAGPGPLLHVLMAASVVSLVPPLLVFVVAQRRFVQGFVFTGVKG